MLCRDIVILPTLFGHIYKVEQSSVFFKRVLECVEIVKSGAASAASAKNEEKKNLKLEVMRYEEMVIRLGRLGLVHEAEILEAQGVVDELQHREFRMLIRGNQSEKTEESEKGNVGRFFSKIGERIASSGATTEEASEILQYIEANLLN